VVDQRTRDTNYATMRMNFRRTKETVGCQGPYRGRAPLDPNRTKDRGGTDRSRQRDGSKTRSTGYYYRHYDKFTGEWERRWTANPQCLPERIHRDPEVRREGNDVTQAAFQSPYAHLAARYYERMIYARHALRTVFYRGGEGAERGPVQRATLGRDNFPELTHRQMFEAGMFLQQDMAMVPTGSEYAGVGNQKDFDPNADGVMVHADCYLVINGKEGHSIHASFFGDAERPIQHGAIVRGFRDADGEPPARVRATRMVLALPDAKTVQYTPHRQRSATSTEI
jgi:hypothetical protein